MSSYPAQGEQDGPAPVRAPAPAPAPRRGGLTWLWVLIGIAAVVLIPTLICGALGFGLVAASMGGTSAGTALVPSVALIPVEGTITSTGVASVAGAAVSGVIIDQIERAEADPNIRAIVLRINSPGGEVVASDEIYHALTLVDKPIVVSMGSLAASGGYYIAAAADYIFATPHTFTGSIGVISRFVTVEELLDEYGVEVTVVSSGDVKDFGSFYRDVTPEEAAYWQDIIDEAYEGFVQIVAEGRGLDPEQVRSFADGRIITGLQALDLGLVDEIGYLPDAIAYAGELGGIEGEPNVVEYTFTPGLLQVLYGYSSQAAPFAGLEESLSDLMTPRLEYRYPGGP
ncbi:MAG: hypothetical protein Kow00124_28130 [Anaerolineae bacterium]